MSAGCFWVATRGGKLVYRGGVGTGFTDKMRRQVFEVLMLIKGEPLAVAGMPHSEARVIRSVQPGLVADVAYTEITSDGMVRNWTCIALPPASKHGRRAEFA